MSIHFLLVPIDLPDTEPEARSPSERARKAREIYDFRRKRDRQIPPDLLGEPVWDILLLAYFLEEEGRPVLVSGICAGSGVANTTALRWQGALEKRGWLQRSEDPSDRRRRYIRLTNEARSMMDRILDIAP